MRGAGKCERLGFRVLRVGVAKREIETGGLLDDYIMSGPRLWPIWIIKLDVNRRCRQSSGRDRTGKWLRLFARNGTGKKAEGEVDEGQLAWLLRPTKSHDSRICGGRAPGYQGVTREPERRRRREIGNELIERWSEKGREGCWVALRIGKTMEDDGYKSRDRR
ncbi:hypothetical protein B0H19DRAFT_1242496 [Mycena capillaripes]|nr:hypothetical protein B0H19DRAFT_1242496 [Mycena capillaripes]